MKHTLQSNYCMVLFEIDLSNQIFQQNRRFCLKVIIYNYLLINDPLKKANKIMKL